jgi:CHASE3 domain sensor protein
LTSDNPVQQRHILMLEKVAAAKLERSDEDINLLRNQGVETASEALRASVACTPRSNMVRLLTRCRTKNDDE